MKGNFTIKNFRAFNDKGADIEIRPITILTGCNSSGKSSFVKALLLLNEIFRKNDRNNVLKNCKLDFTSGTLSMLGDFSTIHNEEAAMVGDDIEITYDVVSSFLPGKYTVSMRFCPTKNDRLNNGILKDVIVKDSESNIIWGIRHSENEKGISALKSRFFAFYSVLYLLTVYNRQYTAYEFTSKVTKDDLVQFIDNDMMPALKDLKKKFGEDAVITAIEYYVNNMSTASDISKWMDKHLECFDKAMEYDILTFIPEVLKINELSKDNFADEFLAFCGSKEIPNITSEDKSRIIEAFIKSDSETFVDFYKQLENDYIDSAYNPVNADSPVSLDLLRNERQSLFGVRDVYFSIPHYFDGFTTVVRLGDDESSEKSEDSDSPTWHEKYVPLFELVYHLLVQLGRDHSSQDDFAKYVSDKGADFADRQYQSDVFDEFKSYVKDGLIDVLSYNVCENMRYVGSSRINIKRLYSLDDRDDFTRTLSEYFEAIRLYSPHYALKYEPDTFMNDWLQKFGIGYKIEINPIGPGLGTMPVIYKDENDKKGRALADYGYGISQLISVLIEIETSILKGKIVSAKKVVDREKGTLNINALLGSSDSYRYESQTIAIEEPETHLHPKYQSLLADMFYEAYTKYGISFIIETHSEYLVRKLQTLVARKQLDSEQVSLTYVEADNRSERKVRRIHIKDDGCLSEPFGEGFFDEADNLAMSLLMIKGGLA